MREIKFRGMGVEGNWHHGYVSILPRNVHHVKAGSYISNSAGSPFAYQVRPETVGQLTGATSVSGKDIYNGDIVQDRTGQLYVVKYYLCKGAFVLERHRQYSHFEDHRLSQDDASDTVLEIVGNVHDNPELRT